MCNGNENEGDFTVLEDLVKKDRLMTIVIFILLLLLAIMLNLMSFMFLILRKRAGLQFMMVSPLQIGTALKSRISMCR